MTEEERALFLGHAIAATPQHYATATIAHLVEAANKVKEPRERTTLLRVVNGWGSEKSRRKSRRKENGLATEIAKPSIH